MEERAKLASKLAETLKNLKEAIKQDGVTITVDSDLASAALTLAAQDTDAILAEWGALLEARAKSPDSPYTDPVKFPSPDPFRDGGEDDEDDVYTVEEFKGFVERGLFADCDGDGHPVRDSLANPNVWISPSRLDLIPEDATHIVWYNR